MDQWDIIWDLSDSAQFLFCLLLTRKVTKGERRADCAVSMELTNHKHITTNTLYLPGHKYIEIPSRHTGMGMEDREQGRMKEFMMIS